MSKKKKKHRKKSKAVKSAPRKRIFEGFPTRKVLTLLLSFAVFMLIYQIGVYFELMFMLHIYCTAAGALIVIYSFMNRGMFSLPKKEQLPCEWGDEEKESFIAEQKARRERSSVLLYFIIPIILTVAFDMIYLLLTVNLGLNI